MARRDLRFALYVLGVGITFDTNPLFKHAARTLLVNADTARLGKPEEPWRRSQLLNPSIGTPTRCDPDGHKLEDLEGKLRNSLCAGANLGLQSMRGVLFD